MEIEGVEVEDLKQEYGTPFYLYIPKVAEKKYNSLYNAFNQISDTEIAYSYKTNYSPEICRDLHTLGAKPEVIAGFEYKLAKKLDQDLSKVIVNGPYKQKEELREYIRNGSKIHVDNKEEFNKIKNIAQAEEKDARLSIRISFDLGENTWSKFGFDRENALKLVEEIGSADSIDLEGIHTHIGTNIVDLEKYRENSKQINSFLDEADQDISYIDVGGGFATKGACPSNKPHGEWEVPSAQEYARAVLEPLKSKLNDRKLILEPGRYLVDEALLLVTKIFAEKQIKGRKSLFVDAGVNNLPSAYYRNHSVLKTEKETERVDVYGPLCMQVDCLQKGLEISAGKDEGDLLLFNNAGAYSNTQSMQFIRSRPPTVKVEDGQSEVIRRAEKFEDIFSRDKL